MFKLQDKPETTKTEFAPLQSGSHRVILKDGYVKKVNDTKYDKVKTNILLRFAVPGVTYTDGDGTEQPRSLFLYETLSTSDKSNLHKILLSNLSSSDIGMTFEDIDNPFAITDYEKHNLTGFYLEGTNLFESSFDIIIGKPKGTSNFNELFSVSPVLINPVPDSPASDFPSV